ncbi:MAG: hypothetical protein KTR16_14445 [Acidiferrobacterales bacterium]|nr:hypothetical protein [Acidiferrobacterales bacterium]
MNSAIHKIYFFVGLKLARRLLLLLALLCTAPVYAGTIETSDLGWQEGQDVSQQLIDLFEQAQVVAGDTLVFSHNYDVQSNVSIQLPSDITLVGAYFGAGLTIRNTEPNMRNGIFKLSDRNTLYNLSFTHKETLTVPPLSAGITNEGKSNTRGILAFADDVTVINCLFYGNVGIHIDASGENLRIIDTHFNEGYGQLRLLGNNINSSLTKVLFENSLGDGIKTVRGVGTKVDNVTVDQSVFLNNRRDGIDTTGGFSNSVVSNSYFVSLFKGLDLKNIFDDGTESLSLAPLNINILVENSTFVDNNNGLAPITLDRGNSNGVKWVTNANADRYLTQKILVRNSSFQNRDGGSPRRAILATDVHSVEWENLTLIGDTSEVRITRNPVNSGAIDASVTTNYNISGTGTIYQEDGEIKPDSYYRSLAGPDTRLRFTNGAGLSGMLLLLLENQ